MKTHIHALLLALLLPALLLPAARGSEEPQNTIVEDLLAVEVVVPVHVTAKDGQPIRDLTRDDFQIFDDGERQEILDFRVVDLDTIVPDERTRRIPDADLPAAARRNFLFLFDLSFSDPIAIFKARTAAREFVIEGLHPSDLAAVATFSLEFGPQLIVTFTPDRAQLARAISSLGLKQRGPEDPLRFIVDTPTPQQAETISAQPTDRVDVLGEARGDYLETLRVLQKQFDRGQRDYDRRRITSWSRAMADMAKALDSIKGQKQIIYFSEGFDSRLLLGNMPSPDDLASRRDDDLIVQGAAYLVDTDQRFGNTGLQSDLYEMLEMFRRADCVIQSVDIGGLRASVDSGASLASNKGQDGLFYIANETGGELFKDANDFVEQLGRVLKRTSVSYLLSFQPTSIAADGSFHKLKVKANLPRGARLSARSGYFAPRPFDQLHPFEKDLLASDAIASANRRDELDLDVLLAPFRAGDGRAYVPVVLEIGGRRLLDGHQEPRLETEIFVYVTDEKGEMRDFFSQRVGIDLRPDLRVRIATTGLKYYGHLDLDPGRYRVRVLVRNASTGRTAVRSIPLDIEGYAGVQPELLRPFFLEEPGSWLLVREAAAEGQDSVVYPFTLGGEPYVPAARAALSPGASTELCLVAYDLGEGPFQIDIQVLDPDGLEILGGELEAVERTITGIAGLDRFRVRFRPTDLERGGYTLQLALTDPGTGFAKTSSIPFTVID